MVDVEAARGQRRLADVAAPQLGGRARDEVVDPALGPDALVEVLVTGEHHGDAVSHEQRLE
jgi:hypothetical protein